MKESERPMLYRPFIYTKDKSTSKVNVLILFLTRSLVDVGSEKIHKNVSDHVVHTIKLGRLINICGYFNDIKKLCKLSQCCRRRRSC